MVWHVSVYRFSKRSLSRHQCVHCIVIFVNIKLTAATFLLTFLVCHTRLAVSTALQSWLLPPILPWYDRWQTPVDWRIYRSRSGQHVEPATCRPIRTSWYLRQITPFFFPFFFIFAFLFGSYHIFFYYYFCWGIQ